MKTRNDLLKFLVKMIVYSDHTPTGVLAVILPNQKDRTQFAKDFNFMLNAVPEYLLPTVLMNNLQSIQFNDARILFLCQNTNIVGITLHQVFISHRVEITEEFYKNILPTMAGRNKLIDTFYDN